MPRWRDDEGGQAAVELVALLPLVAVVLAAGWQLAVAAHALWATDGAARAAARAAAVGGDARVAARAALPPGLRNGLVVRPGEDGRVAVSARIPRVLGLPSLGSVSSSSRFRTQR